jgi:diaminopimelate decarboxylase
MSPFNHPALEQIDALGPLLRRVGIDVEADPTDSAALWETPLLRAITLIEVPEPYNPMPNCGDFFGHDPVDYRLQLAIAERIARHDASCVLAMPTPTMSGHAVRVLGNSDQIDTYFRRYKTRPRRSFFAVTEPQVGSDATACRSEITAGPGRRSLTAHKKLVGSALQADIGLIFVRDPSARTHRFVLCDAATTARFQITRLPMHGLAGADLTEMRAEAVPVSDDMILGHGLNRGLRDGFFAMNSVFDRYRPAVSALAIGSARGLIDDMATLGLPAVLIDPLRLRHAVLMDRLEEIAAACEAGQPRLHETSRLKLDAVAFLDEVVAAVFHSLPPGDIAAVPGLLKRTRDAKSYEYMEGTSHVHLLKAFRSFAASA